MKIDMAAVGRTVELIQAEFQIALQTLKEKGAARFVRPLVVGFAVVYVSYAYVYVPPAKKLAGLQKKIEAAKAISQYAEQYKTLRDRLLEVYAVMPPFKDKDTWLTSTMIESMKAENLISDSIVPPEETQQSGFIFQKITVSLQMKFSELISWLIRLEGTKPELHVASLELTKRTEMPGTSNVACSISTVVPARKLTP